MTTPILRDRSLILGLVVIVVVVLIGLVVLVVTDHDTAVYVVFVTGPVISTIVGLALTHQVKTVQDVTETVSAQVAAGSDPSPSDPGH